MRSFIFTLLLTTPFLLNAQDYNKFGIEKSSGSSLVPLEIGSKAPEFSGKDQFGNHIALSEIVQDGPVLVIFYRGYWCGICKRSLEEFQSEFSSLSSAGVQIVAVAPEVESNVSKTVNQNNLEFSVISDSDNSIMKKYNVAFDVTQAYQDKVIKYYQTTLQEINGQNNAVLPIPATYLIDTNGKIKYVHFDIDYSKRATVKDILAQL
jgi:peroxiredoxin